MVEKLHKFIIRANNRDKITSILTVWKKEIMHNQIP